MKNAVSTTEMISRTVKVNRAQSPQEMLEATNRSQDINATALESIPKGEGEEIEVIFFKIGRYVTITDLEKEYELRGLIVDPYSQAKVNEDDPTFADTYPNSTYWKDPKGFWCYCSFFRWYHEGDRVVTVGYGVDWYGSVWFGGVHKKKPEAQL